jgi:hypothetical protein
VGAASLWSKGTLHLLPFPDQARPLTKNLRETETSSKWIDQLLLQRRPPPPHKAPVHHSLASTQFKILSLNTKGQSQQLRFKRSASRQTPHLKPNIVVKSHFHVAAAQIILSCSSRSSTLQSKFLTVITFLVSLNPLSRPKTIYPTPCVLHDIFHYCCCCCPRRLHRRRRRRRWATSDLRFTI